MKRPLIGVTASHDTDNDRLFINSAYLQAVRTAGGIPVILPMEISEEDLRTLVTEVDGVLFTGGDDIHPFLYGEETNAKCGAVSQPRDSMEMALVPLAMEFGRPILGICRGIQILNTALGGTLYQDIPTQFVSELSIAHRQPFAYKVPSHTVDVIPGTLLSRILGEEHASIAVNSMHHQAIKDVAPGLEVCAYAPDHMIESVYAPDYPFLLGVQWHPEHLAPIHPDAAKLFSAFVEACR
ncbi:MAG TPA: gamma-glutamyl-gamma-aminobutyrate hydrolase family protein [Candidatus Lachnoclostridium pullistercoris]|uniref:Gamma-glutamyl-gamma-aminobutyrate hydrolase family protein n=1 Tax=Candidatus Lachnoclostridium pullistercoris TaxID=2838632 RepID=A0A9D2T6K1_9FIRM|nr:gamma-glutamyl-gamma-aminobutyrate hydrolase family protein [Candidatus Lachnoclostridium pullistercoris]